MDIQNAPDIRKKLKDLAKKIQQYQSGEVVSEKHKLMALNEMKGRLYMGPDGVTYVEKDEYNTDFKAEYEEVINEALVIKEACDFELPKLPPFCYENPVTGLAYLREWCIDTTASVQANINKQKRTQPAGGITPAEEKAYQSYDVAINQKPELAGKTDKEVYKWLKPNGIDDYILPTFNTWQRQVRAGRNKYGTQKNTPRGGRTSPSVKSYGDIELSEITNQFKKEKAD
jgi:hypothetical protein